MLLRFVDFNGADELFTNRLASSWRPIESALGEMLLHLKASDQAGIEGRLIFDPVGTNAAIKGILSVEDTERGMRRWAPNVRMPEQFRFLGSDVDFVQDGVLIEVQFSNYPFLLNNAVRGELLFKSRVNMEGAPIDALVIITKGHMLPASNSTLYYEQAQKQLAELIRNKIIDVPTRLVGLSCDLGVIDAVFTNYSEARYSRTTVNRSLIKVNVSPGRTAASRSRIDFH